MASRAASGFLVPIIVGAFIVLVSVDLPERWLLIACGCLFVTIGLYGLWMNRRSRPS